MSGGQNRPPFGHLGQIRAFHTQLFGHVGEFGAGQPNQINRGQGKHRVRRSRRGPNLRISLQIAIEEGDRHGCMPERRHSPHRESGLIQHEPGIRSADPLAEQSGDGVYLRTIIKTDNPDRYGIRVGDYFL